MWNRLMYFEKTVASTPFMKQCNCDMEANYKRTRYICLTIEHIMVFKCYITFRSLIIVGTKFVEKYFYMRTDVYSYIMEISNSIRQIENFRI